MKNYHVYILASPSGVLCTGVTGNIAARIQAHKEKSNKGFTQKYNATRLIYYEPFTRIGNAILREKQIKKWPRKQKIALVESVNPRWLELALPLQVP